MKYYNSNDNADSVYPGQYIPLHDIEVLLERQVKFDDSKDQEAQVNIHECKDSFQIEVALPGANREDIFVEIFDNTLSVVVLLTSEGHVKKTLKVHEFDTHLMERYITLPPYADAEFISAEYRQGILKIYVPKTKVVFKEVTQQIVIY